MKKLYGAYGSNLNIDQMSVRCPGASVYGASELQDWQLVFKKSGSGAYLSVEPAMGFQVPLGIWSIDEDHEAALDRYEGYPHFYQKKTFKLPVRHDGEIQEEDVMIYIMNFDRPAGIPSISYLETCREGYEDFWFDQNTLIDAALAAGMPMVQLVDEDMLLTCPSCGKRYTGMPALSRKDSQTLICPRCGSREAMEAIGMVSQEIDAVLDRMDKAGGFDWEGFKYD